MFEEVGLKPNTINGRVRSVRVLVKFLYGQGYIDKDFGADIPLIKVRRSLFLPSHNGIKLTYLPVHRLLDIMSTSWEWKRASPLAMVLL